MRASGCEVPQWMLDLKAPSKADRKKLKLAPISRKDISRTHGSGEGSKADRRTHERKRLMGGGVAKTKVVGPRAGRSGRREGDDAGAAAKDAKSGMTEQAEKRTSKAGKKKAAREVALDE